MLCKQISKLNTPRLIREQVRMIYHKALREETLSSNVKECEYAVRGAIPIRGEAIKKELESNPEGHGYPFDKITPCNIGNPQAVGQGFITYNREVISSMVYSNLINSSIISPDAKNRVKLFNDNLATPMGAYTTNSKGYSYIRQQVAQFINNRDGPAVKCDWNNIYLTNGASEAVRTAFKLLIRQQKDGVLIPIPQYPLYSALLTLDGGTMVKYYLDEEKNWGINPAEIEQRVQNAKELGINLRAMVVINPGNPTGQVLRRKDIEDIIKVCYKHELVICADEVYQQNTYKDDLPFISFRQVLAEMGEPYSDSVELISMHSVSKGLQGECGFRGGYFEAHNMDLFANDILYKLKSIELCSNTTGQIATSLMVDPPKVGRESDECVEQYTREKGLIYAGMKKRAEILSDAFNGMTNVTCTEIEGAMYAFPQVKFSEKSLRKAEKHQVPADFMYCLDLMEKTGIMTVPGSGFGQEDGSYHYRITNLVTPTEDLVEMVSSLKTFNEKYHIAR